MKLFFYIILMCVCFLPNLTLASGKPVVRMANELYTYNMAFNNIYLSDTDRAVLWRAINSKLLSMQNEGRLPFQLINEVSAGGHYMSELALDSDIYLIPAVMVNSARDTSYSSTTSTYYNSNIVSGISLIFCIPEEDYERGGVSFRMLGMVPMVNSAVIGRTQKSENGRRSLVTRTTPISETEKVSKFISLSKEAIEKQINFSSAMKNLKDPNALFNMDTYQVTNVRMSSPKAQQTFQGQDEKEIKFLTAYNYTAGLQQKTKKIVYPPVYTDNAFANNVVDTMYSLSLDSPNGSVDVGISQPAHRIELDISGANYTYANNIVAYKVWLAKHTRGGEFKELTRGYSQNLIDDGSIDFNTKDMYSRLLMGVAWELGYAER